MYIRAKGNVRDVTVSSWDLFTTEVTHQPQEDVETCMSYS